MARAVRPGRSLSSMKRPLQAGVPITLVLRDGVEALLEQAHATQCVLEQESNFVIGRSARNNPMPLENAPGISIDHKNRMIAGIKKNRVGGLRPHPIERKQFVTQFRSRAREHPLQRAAITRIEKAHKNFQPLRLLPEVS